MVSKFFYFSLTVMKLIVAKNQTPKSTDCHNAARKSLFFKAVFGQFYS